MKKEPEHSVFAFSASPRWIPCPASMAFPENLADRDGGEYADEGTAAHKLAAIVLKSKSGMSAEDWIGKVIRGGKREFEITEEFAGHVQTYVDDVKRRALGAYLMVEQRVTLNEVDGFDESNYGTADVIIGVPAQANRAAYGIVEDLKFGQGERVYAWERAGEDAPFTMDFHLGEDEAIKIVPNYQLMLYALAALADLRLLIDEPTGILIVIHQPRVNSLTELWVPLAVLERFALFAAEMLARAEEALKLGPDAMRAKVNQKYFKAGEKQCRWCQRAQCDARDAKVQEEAGADFEVIEKSGAPLASDDPAKIGRAMRAMPFIMDWARAIIAKGNQLISDGVEVIGPDGKPYKIVEGKEGNRAWSDEAKAEALLVGVLGPKAYAPQKILTAAAAAKLLDKTATKKAWADNFAPLIKRAPGKPTVVQGSDPRPPYVPASSADEFDIEESE